VARPSSSPDASTSPVVALVLPRMDAATRVSVGQPNTIPRWPGSASVSEVANLAFAQNAQVAQVHIANEPQPYLVERVAMPRHGEVGCLATQDVAVVCPATPARRR